MTTERPIIQLSRWSVLLNKKAVVENLSLELPASAFLSIIGPNGAGKTSLLKSLLRIIPAEGEATIAGERLGSYRPKDLARLIAYVPQTGIPGAPFSVEEMLLMARYSYGTWLPAVNRQDLAAVDQAIETCGLSAFRERNFSSLSGGEKQKVLLAAAIAQETRILLLDEPATFLDPQVEEEMFAILRRLQSDSGTTIVIVTHDLNRALLASSHILALKSGRQVYFGACSADVQEKVLPSLFETEFLFVPHPQTKAPMILPRAGYE